MEHLKDLHPDFRDLGLRISPCLQSVFADMHQVIGPHLESWKIKCDLFLSDVCAQNFTLCCVRYKYICLFCSCVHNNTAPWYCVGGRRVEKLFGASVGGGRAHK